METEICLVDVLVFACAVFWLTVVVVELNAAAIVALFHADCVVEFFYC